MEEVVVVTVFAKEFKIQQLRCVSVIIQHIPFFYS